jgi:excinuclease ABC subunit B
VVNHAQEISLEDLPQLIEKLEVEMKEAARKQAFEQAAVLRDRIKKLRERLLHRPT